jgi:hypothetical protein
VRSITGCRTACTRQSAAAPGGRQTEGNPGAFDTGMPRSPGPASLLVAVLAVTGGTLSPPPASADEREREPGEPAPHVRWNRGVFIAGHAGSVAGVSTGGMGLDIEVAHGRGRWQLFGDAFLAWTMISVQQPPPGAALATTPPAEARGVDGFLARVGVGGRRVMRAFEPDHSASIELYVEGGAGLSRTWWNGGGTLTRPDLSFGAGWQVRALEEDRGWIIRFGLKAFVQPPLDSGACGALCPDTGHRVSDSGFIGQFGASW